MHDVTEGGLLGAIWEIAKASNVGIKIWKENILLQRLLWLYVIIIR